jgi:signal peptide peptidase SppA
MNLNDIIHGQWAISPDGYNQILAAYESHISGDKLDLKSIQKANEALFNLAVDGELTDSGFVLRDGAAIIEINGVLSKRQNFFSFLFGGASTEQIGSMFLAAINDERVDHVILKMDSPGGNVVGTADLARLIFDNRGKKRITAFADGTLASAAYWIASAAHEILISSDTNNVGSIGVVTTVEDFSRAQENFGLKITEIVTGKFKRAGSSNKPLDADSQDYLQGIVDRLLVSFANDVAEFRGMTFEEVIAMSEEGKIFIGRDAIDNGMVDGVSTIENILINNSTQGIDMDINELKEKHAEVYRAVRAEALEGNVEKLEAAKAVGIEEGKALGIKAESERIAGIEALALEGHDDLIASLKADGKTTADQAAGLILKAEKESRHAVAEKTEAEGAPPVLDSEDTNNANAKDFRSLVAVYKEEHKCSKIDAMKAVAKLHPGAYKPE